MDRVLRVWECPEGLDPILEVSQESLDVTLRALGGDWAEQDSVTLQFLSKRNNSVILCSANSIAPLVNPGQGTS